MLHEVGMFERTLAAENDGQIPQLGHVESLKHLSLIACTITIQRKRHILLVLVVVRERDARTDRYLCANNTITAIETGREHVHAATLAIRNTLSPPQQLANNRPHSSTPHHSKAMASVGSDEMIRLLNRVLDTHSNCFLSGRKMAEPADLLLLVEAICSHLHPSDSDHVVVHLLEFFLRGLESVRWWVKIVGFEGFVAEGYFEGFVVFLWNE